MIREVIELILFDARTVVDRGILVGFAGGFIFMFLLDEVFIDMILLG